MKNLLRVLCCLLAAGMLAGYGGGVYAAVAGHVQFVNGVVQLTSAAGQSHVLQKGDAVSEGDTLSSAPAASAQIKMSDGGLVAMRPDTQLKIDSYQFNGQQDGSEQGFFSLFKGGFRAITGLIGQLHKGNYRITTPSATIGIRGTDHETLVVVAGSDAAALAPPGTYNKVNTGETSMTNGKGTIAILPNQMGYAAADGRMPLLQPVNPKLFNVIPAPTQASGSKSGEVRESVVVDSTVQDAGISLNYTPQTSASFFMRPITATVTTITPGITGTGITGTFTTQQPTVLTTPIKIY
ncbi:MAG: FecR domain-containing protein [Gallionella sp.]|nr:FecR domain-containing protein [Gallionella sp.]